MKLCKEEAIEIYGNKVLFLIDIQKIIFNSDFGYLIQDSRYIQVLFYTFYLYLYTLYPIPSTFHIFALINSRGLK
ncbi:MAG: hypothetical protein A2V93_07890 [Ignavibacteria bacterium RBG_16_34_14]|nr:MAG: hypothetical protein A2V93_07890 [Ignavibacteria bacterium RBG_16_34_14]